MTIGVKKCKITIYTAKGAYYVLLRKKKYYPFGGIIVKKFFSIFIALILTVSLLSATAVAFAEDAVAVTEITLSPESKTVVVGEDTEFEIKATVKPSDATDTKVNFSVKDSVAGITVDENGKVKVSKDVAVGEYAVIATANTQTDITKEFKITVRAKLAVNEAAFFEKLDTVNKQQFVIMSKDFNLGNEWLKKSADVAAVFAGINYKVEGDDGYDKDAKYDVISVETCSPSGDPKEEKDWTNRSVSSTFSMQTAGWWLFRYVVKDSEDNVIARSPVLVRYAVDNAHPIVALSETLTKTQEDGLTAGTNYSVSTSLTVTDSSSTTTTYKIYRMINNEWTEIYDSVSNTVKDEYKDYVTEGGTIKPVEADIKADKTPVYKVVYKVTDSEGYNGVNGEGATFEPELLLFVKQAPATDKTDPVDVWKIVLYVIAGLSAVGIIVLLCVKPKQKTPAPVAADNADKKDESKEEKSE